MPLWSFPGVVTGVNNPYVCATLDLGCRLYADTAIHVAGVNKSLRALDKIAELLPAGTRILAVCEPLPGGPVTAHLTLEDGRDVASVIKNRPLPRCKPAAYGGLLTAKAWTYPAVVETVTDGDSFRVRLETGQAAQTYRTAVRVAHVNAPEKNTAEGQAALVWAERVLTTGMPVTVRSSALDKYGRLLGTAQTPDGRDFGTELVTAGHAVPYEGGARG